MFNTTILEYNKASFIKITKLRKEVKRNMDEQNNTRSPILMIIGIILIVIVAGYFLIAKKSSRPSALEPKENTVSQPNVTPKNAGLPNYSQKEIAISGSEFSFDPSVITLNAGEKVRLTFKNTGKAPHNLAISELNLATKTISGGQSDTIEFTAPNSGTFSFICSVGNHAAKGMTGTVRIE